MPKPTVVLVHGAWADGSGYEGVYTRLTERGYTVRVVQNPTTSLTDDNTVTRNQLDQVGGPVVLVGHSWGGFVITEAGTHEKVAALVYLTAFGPEVGDTELSMIGTFPQDGPLPPILAPVDGFVMIDHDKFPEAFAGSVPRAKAQFMADSQVPFGAASLNEPTTQAAWQTKPSWYLHVTDDLMIPPAAQLTMANRMGSKITSVPGNHAIYVSDPDACVAIIQEAIDAVS